MFCTKCVKEIPDGIKFCPYCGNKVDSLRKTQEKILKSPQRVNAEVNQRVRRHIRVIFPNFKAGYILGIITFIFMGIG